MANIFNTPEDVKKAVSILNWCKQYMEINEAHASKMGKVKASIMLLQRAGAGMPALADDEIMLVGSTLKNCLKFYDINARESLDSRWVLSLQGLSEFKADWF